MERLSDLAEALRSSSTCCEKLEHLNSHPPVEAFLQRPSALRTFLATLSAECEVVIKSLIAIGQAERLFPWEGIGETTAAQMRLLLEDLLPVERFYREIGGLVGYHVTLLKQLQRHPEERGHLNRLYHRPNGVELFNYDEEVRTHVLAGIASLPSLAEIYPVGGAADRLRLHDALSKVPLPSARLEFCGKTLLEWILHDLQAREFLYFKLFDEQITVPIAMMTSQEKDNHSQILALCEEKKWFGRPASSFAFFCQPAVPTMDKEGNWCVVRPLKPLMKPGGHGVVWKLAKDQGVLDWLSGMGKKKVVVRQINNPIAGCDYGLLAFVGIGCAGDKKFGFASCPRQVNAAEGVNVLVEQDTEDQVHYCLTNIEYCDFDKYGIADTPVSTQSCHSQFPSNTNILFADLTQIASAAVQCPIPGMIVNLKKIAFQDDQGTVREEELARLESTMQNIADSFVYPFPKEEKREEHPELSTFLTYNHRHKTISTIKKEYTEGGSLLETPEGCYGDLYRNGHDLLVNYCGFSLPEFVSEETLIHSGPPFDFSYHPALGPLYSIISQKLRRGTIIQGSQLHLDIAEIDCENLFLQGSLKVTAQMPMGHLDHRGKLHYSHRGGRCRLRNVAVINEGCLPRSISACWRRESLGQGRCEIMLHGDSEFEACGVRLMGDMRIEVEEGFQIKAVEREGKIMLEKQELGNSRWFWVYEINRENEIYLKREESR